MLRFEYQHDAYAQAANGLEQLHTIARSGEKAVDGVSDKRLPGKMDLAKLRQAIAAHFNEGELRTLCFDLLVDYENLPGEGKDDKARELVAYFQRRGRISALVEACRRQRPSASW